MSCHRYCLRLSLSEQPVTASSEYFAIDPSKGQQFLLFKLNTHSVITLLITSSSSNQVVHYPLSHSLSITCIFLLSHCL
uniref:Uncharacterized protein n=1 Tax=Rhodnius prolixus TaxID=13249 RepID=A0A905R0M2_RHOPR